MNKEYYIIRNKYLANGLSFLGFKYYIIREEGNITYSFKNTEEFTEALLAITSLKKK